MGKKNKKNVYKQVFNAEYRQQCKNEKLNDPHTTRQEKSWLDCKVRLQDGRLGYVVSVFKIVSTWYYNCHVCKKQQLSFADFLHHTNTKKHANRMKMTVHLPHRFMHVENPPHIKVEEEVLAECEIQTHIDNFEKPLVGLEYLLELVSKDKKPFNYVCLLCNRQDTKDTVFYHLVSPLHCLKFYKMFFPSVVSKIKEGKKINFQTYMDLCSHVAASIQSCYGRLKPRQIFGGNWFAQKFQILQKIDSGIHFREVPGKTFESCVDITHFNPSLCPYLRDKVGVGMAKNDVESTVTSNSLENQDEALQQHSSSTLPSTQSSENNDIRIDENMKNFDVVALLKQVVSLESSLGSLKPKVEDLLSTIMQVSMYPEKCVHLILANEDHCILLETVKEKFFGVLEYKFVESNMIDTVKNVIEKIKLLLQHEAIHNEIPEDQISNQRDESVNDMEDESSNGPEGQSLNGDEDYRNVGDNAPLCNDKLDVSYAEMEENNGRKFSQFIKLEESNDKRENVVQTYPSQSENNLLFSRRNDRQSGRCFLNIRDIPFFMEKQGGIRNLSAVEKETLYNQVCSHFNNFNKFQFSEEELVEVITSKLPQGSISDRSHHSSDYNRQFSARTSTDRQYNSTLMLDQHNFSADRDYEMFKQKQMMNCRSYQYNRDNRNN